MITRDLRYNNQYHKVDIPQYIYDEIQRVAYSMNISTRTVMEAILTCASHHQNEDFKILKKYAYKIHHPYKFRPYTNN